MGGKDGQTSDSSGRAKAEGNPITRLNQDDPLFRRRRRGSCAGLPIVLVMLEVVVGPLVGRFVVTGRVVVVVLVGIRIPVSSLVVVVVDSVRGLRWILAPSHLLRLRGWKHLVWGRLRWWLWRLSWSHLMVYQITCRRRRWR